VKPWDATAIAAEKSPDEGSAYNADHGMMAASILAAHINDLNGVAGVAPGAHIVPYKAVQPNIQAVAKAIDLAVDAQVDVITTSLGGSVPDYFLLDWANYTKSFKWYTDMQAALQRAEASKVIVTAAAGNRGWNVARNLFAGRNTKDDGTGTAIFPQIITVGAIDVGLSVLAVSKYTDVTSAQQFTDARDFSSNWGNGVDIWAPDGQKGLGSCCFSHSLTFNHPGGTVENSSVYSSRGTSFATPAIAGMAALAKALDPSIDRARFLNLLKTQSPTTRTYQEPGVRDYPYSYPGKTCGSIKDHACGKPLPSAPTISLTVPNIYAVVSNLGNSMAEKYSGTLSESLGKLYLNTPTGAYKLNWSGNDNATFIKEMAAKDIAGEGLLIDSLVNQPIEVDGWLKGSELYVLQVRQLPPTVRHCIESEIVTDTHWSWWDGNAYKPTVVVPEFLNKVTIPQTASGQSVKPIWDDAPLLQCTSGWCPRYFYYDHVFPTGYKVEKAEVWMQGDAIAYMYVNMGYVGGVDADHSFNTGSYAYFDIPQADLATMFPANATSVRVDLQGLGYYYYTAPINNAAYQPAYAAKVKIKACTP
jgi:hypothetical protein